MGLECESQRERALRAAAARPQAPCWPEKPPPVGGVFTAAVSQRSEHSVRLTEVCLDTRVLQRPGQWPRPNLGHRGVHKGQAHLRPSLALSLPHHTELMGGRKPGRSAVKQGWVTWGRGVRGRSLGDVTEPGPGAGAKQVLKAVWDGPPREACPARLGSAQPPEAPRSSKHNTGSAEWGRGLAVSETDSGLV